MSRRAIVVDSRALLVAVDDPPPVAERWWSLALGLVLDEEKRTPPVTSLRGETTHPDVVVSAAGDGSFCLVARPWFACPPLLAPSYTIVAALSAEGYLPVDVVVSVTIQQRQVIAPAPVVGGAVLALNSIANLIPGQLLAIGPTGSEERARIRHLGPGPLQVTLDGGLHLPHAIGDPVVADAWTPIDLGFIALRRAPVVIRGRAVRRDATTNIVTPVANATIALIDFWNTLDAVHAQLPGSMTDPNPATRAFMVSSTPGVVAGRLIGLGQIARQDLAPAVGDDRRLVAAVSDGDRGCRVSDRQGLGVGTVLRVDPDQLDASEAVTIAAVTGFGPPDQPGDLTLELPFRRSHRAGTRLVPVTPGPPGAPIDLRRDVLPGDVALFVESLASLPNGVDARLTGGTPPVERQRVFRVEATSDADGYFALPQLHRVAAVRLRATAPPLAPVDLTFHPEYATPENWLDVVFA
jgi:hypothetical protein